MRGVHCASTIRLIAVAEPVSSSTSQVRAMVKTASPSTEMVCPVHNMANGRACNARANCKRPVNTGCTRAVRLMFVLQINLRFHNGPIVTRIARQIVDASFEHTIFKLYDRQGGAARANL